MKQNITITKEDLDRAIALPWDTQTCVFAQAVARELGERVTCCHNYGALTETKAVEVASSIHVVGVFDEHFGQFGDKDYEAVAKLLPCAVECEILAKEGLQ